MQIIACHCGEGKVPGRDAREAVRRSVRRARACGCCGAISKPRKDDRHAAANGFVFGEGGTFTEGRCTGSLPIRLPCGEMRAMEVDLCGAGVCGDDGTWQAALAFVESEHVGDGEVVSERVEVHRDQCRCCGNSSEFQRCDFSPARRTNVKKWTYGALWVGKRAECLCV